MIALARCLGALALLLAIGVAPPAAADDWQMAQGTFNTYRSDRGGVDSRINYYVRYKESARANSFYIGQFLMVDPHGHHDFHMWTKTCVEGINCIKVCHQTLDQTWDSVNVGWRIQNQFQISVKFWVTNSTWDCSGIWGETWTGQVTLGHMY